MNPLVTRGVTRGLTLKNSYQGAQNGTGGVVALLLSSSTISLPLLCSNCCTIGVSSSSSPAGGRGRLSWLELMEGGAKKKVYLKKKTQYFLLAE